MGVHRFASEILRRSGDNQTLGINWIRRFIKRHRNLIKAKSGRLIEMARLKAMTEANITPWFERLRTVVDQYNILSSRIYNMDETGFQEGENTKSKVIGSIDIRGAQLGSSGNTAWITIIECIRANGTSLQPSIIFKSVNAQSAWMPKDRPLPDWHYQCNLSGWTNSTLSYWWLETCFIPETQPADPGDWRLLIIDGFVSHIGADFQLLAFQSKVQLLYLPAHTSHRLQPLDLACFSPLKTAYRRAITESREPTLSAPASKRRFISIYDDLRVQCLNISNIEAGFEASGIWPINPLRVINELRQKEAALQPQTPTSTRTNQLFWTPTSRHDISVITRNLMASVSTDHSSRYLRRRFEEVVTRKLSRETANQAAIHAELQVLKLRDGSRSNQRSRAVRIDPNERFTHIEDFVRAEEEARAIDERDEARALATQARLANNPTDIATQNQQQTFEEMLFEFQV